MKILRQRIRIFFSLSPMKNEELSNADAHIEYFEVTLGYCGNCWSDLAPSIGDNCFTNQSFSTKTKSNCIDFAIHRFNFSTKELFSSCYDEISKMNSIMLKLKKLIRATNLKSFAHFKAKTNSVIRYSYTYTMIQ